MKKLLRHTLSLAIVLLTTAGLTSCEDEHDLWMRDNIVGTWQIYDVSSYDYDVPYHSGDLRNFSTTAPIAATAVTALTSTATGTSPTISFRLISITTTAPI